MLCLRGWVRRIVSRSLLSPDDPRQEIDTTIIDFLTLSAVLSIKEVNFAVEIITVIEHGKRNHLSIVRFTQEKGAASSFHKVVDTMNSVFTGRGLLVQDKRKAKMMIKTLNS